MLGTILHSGGKETAGQRAMRALPDAFFLLGRVHDLLLRDATDATDPLLSLPSSHAPAARVAPECGIMESASMILALD